VFCRQFLAAQRSHPMGPCAGRSAFQLGRGTGSLDRGLPSLDSLLFDLNDGVARTDLAAILN
jgi:hypothetical protein